MTPCTLRRILLSCWLTIPLVAGAQHLLDKQIPSFSIAQRSPEDALRQLGQCSNVHFSYKTDLLQPEHTISLSAENRTIGQLLHLLFKDDFEYIEQQDFVIVVKRSSYYIISGHIADKATGLPMDSVQISSSNGVISAFSNKQGLFRLKVPVCYPVSYVLMEKDFYVDTFVRINNPADKDIEAQMQPVAIPELLPVVTTAHSEDKRKKPGLQSVLFNIRRRSTRFEASGIFNVNEHNAYNFQLAGAVNVVGRSLKGVQIAGIHNLVMDSTAGVQLSGLVNKTEGPVNGVQIAAVNHARKLRGVQVGVINIADSSEGYSIGLLNFVRNASGYHSLSLFTSDLMTTNLELKLGNNKLYTVFLAGMNMVPGQKLYSAGVGLGHDVLLGSRLTIATEASYQAVNAGSWDNRLFQLRSSLNLRIRKGLTLFAGPSFNHYTNSQDNTAPGYKYMGIALYKGSKEWLGWQAGITSADLLWSSGKQYVHKEKGWALQAGLGGGFSFDDFNEAKWFSADLRLQRGIIDNTMAIMLTAGVNHRLSRSTDFIDPSGKGFLASPGITDVKLLLGLKIFVVRKFYAAAELGIAGRRMIWSPSVGWAIGHRLDLSARIESANAPMLLRLAYTLWRSR
jgi:hypothetical protein